MKQHLVIQQTLVIAFLAVAIVATGAFVSGFAGRLNFSIGADGIQLEIDGGSAPSE